MRKKTVTGLWRFVVLLATLSVVSGCNDSDSSSNGSTTPSTRTWLNLAYATTSTSQKMDIYLPTTGNGPFPTVIWIHGGAFKFGDKANPQSLTALNNAGYAVASVNYRLSGEAQWPAQLEDLKGIVTYLRTNASQPILFYTVGKWPWRICCVSNSAKHPMPCKFMRWMHTIRKFLADRFQQTP